MSILLGKYFITKKSSNAHKIKHHKTYYLHIYMVYCVSALLSINPRSLYVVGKCSTADIHLQTSRCGFKCFLFYLDQMLNNRVVTWWQRIWLPEKGLWKWASTPSFDKISDSPENLVTESDPWLYGLGLCMTQFSSDATQTPSALPLVFES